MMTKDRSIAPNLKVIFALTLVHFTGDFYSAFTTPLFPAFADKLNLTMAQVGLIAGINRFLSFIVQPSVGYLADRHQGRGFILGGLFVLVVFIPLTGIASSIWMLILFLSIGSIGSSMFHPCVAGMIPLYSGNKKGLCMSLFNTGGTFSFALGPIFITWFVARYGLDLMPVTMVIGFVVMIYIYRTVPVPVSEGMHNNGFFGTLKENFGTVWKSIFLIWLVMVLRAVVGQSFMTFMPLLFVQEGFSLVSAGSMIAIFTIAGTLSGICAGVMADKIGNSKPVFLIAHGLMTPALLLLMNVSGNFVYAAVFFAGFFVLATLPLGVTLAQELAPKGRSMVSSLMMGLAYGLGGAMAPIVGKLSDIYGIRPTLMGIALIPLLTLVLITLFPGRNRS